MCDIGVQQRARPMECISLTGAQRRQRFDTVRRELRQMWEALNVDERPASKQKRRHLREMIYGIGMGGRDDEAPATGEAGREEAWAQLGEDLSIATKSLGTEALALMGYHYRVNVLLFLCHSESYDFGAGVPQALDRWRAATPQQQQEQLQQTGRAGQRPGGRWHERVSGTSYDVVATLHHSRSAVGGHLPAHCDVLEDAAGAGQGRHHH